MQTTTLLYEYLITISGCNEAHYYSMSFKSPLSVDYVPCIYYELRCLNSSDSFSVKHVHDIRSAQNKIIP